MKKSSNTVQIETMGARRVEPSRPLDYIYDTDFTVSSFKDHIKQVEKSVIHKTSLLPVFQNMFSVLPNYSPYTIQIQSGQLDPNLGLPRTKPVVVTSSSVTAAGGGAGPSSIEAQPIDAQVSGPDRYKYFKRPLVPYHPTIVSHLIYQKKGGRQGGGRRINSAGTKNPVDEKFTLNGGGPVNVSVQTLYRESEAQTDPYSPEFYLAAGVDPDSPPEILALSALSFGQGLPASVVELDMIERARAKRVWEQSLPEVVDEESFQRRLRMMEEMELIEWKERENEIERLQEARLEILTNVIKEREIENSNINTERMVKIWQRKLQERDSLVEKLDKKRSKLMRKLARKREDNSREKRAEKSLIDDYVNYASTVYAPKARNGFIIPSLPESIQFETVMDASVHNVPELKKALQGMCQPIITLKEEIRSSEHRKEQLLKQQLEFMAETIEAKNNSSRFGEKEKRQLKCVIKLEKEVERPPTPVLDFQTEEDDVLFQSVLYLQRHLRGRTVQIERQRELARRISLIREIRIRKNIAEAGISPEDPLVSIQQLSLDQKIDRAVDETITSELVGNSLDFLNKELVRLQEQQRIAAMVKLAERTRRIREAEESGKRQIELQRLHEQDEIFRQTMQIHGESVETYLEDIIISTVQSSARLQARELVREYASQLSQADLAAHEKRLNSESAESSVPAAAHDDERVISNLLSTFLFPHVEKEFVQQNLESSNRQYLLAAHQAVHGGLSNIVKILDETFGAGNDEEKLEPLSPEPTDL